MHHLYNEHLKAFPLLLNNNHISHHRDSTYKETTPGGKLWGMDFLFSHKALSLEQVHPAGHFTAFFASVRSKRYIIHKSKEHHFVPLFAFSILRVRTWMRSRSSNIPACELEGALTTFLPLKPNSQLPSSTARLQLKSVHWCCKAPQRLLLFQFTTDPEMMSDGNAKKNKNPLLILIF